MLGGISGTGRGDDDDNGNGSDDLIAPPQQLARKRRPMLPGMNEDVFSLAEGAIVLQWPGRLSKVSAADAQDWLELIVRKIKRASEAPPDDSGDDENE